jgi:hypothetical protein
LGWYGIGTQYSKPHVHASAVVSSRWSRKLATRAERTMDPAQPITTHGHAGVCVCPGGQGTIVGPRPAKAVSMGSQTRGAVPQGVGGTCALTALIGINEGANKNIAPITMVLTTLRSFIFVPELR